jgi:transcription-repair coupling factor (superfamily II helicase)
VSDASKAQHALSGAPGSLRVVDEKTVYLRMPPTFMEPEALLMVLRNLMLAAHDRDVNGEPPPAPKLPPALVKKPVTMKR